MRVRVVPYAELRRLVPNGSAEVWLDLPDGATVADALRALNIVTEERLIVGVDRAYATPETPLHDNAEVTLVTPMMGGTTSPKSSVPSPKSYGGPGLGTRDLGLRNSGED